MDLGFSTKIIASLGGHDKQIQAKLKVYKRVYLGTALGWVPLSQERDKAREIGVNREIEKAEDRGRE